MKPPSWCVLLVAALWFAEACPADAQTIPGLPRRATPQRTAEQAPPVPTVMRPAEGEVVVGDLVIAVQVPPNVPARRYTIEAGYWDPAKNDWAYPGTLGDDFSGGTTATTRIAADMRMKWNQKATRWKIHVRTTEPPGGWGPWREFGWQAAPAIDRTAPAATPSPTTAPTNIATTGGESGKPGMMVPGTTTPQPGQPTTGTPPTIPSPGPPDARTAPPTPPGTNVPAVQQPPAATIPNPGPPDAQKLPTLPNPGPPDTRRTPTYPNPGPPSTSVPAVQQPPTQALPQTPRQLPGIPNLPVQIPRSLPKTRSGSAGTQPADTRSSQPPGTRETRLLSMTRLAVWDGKPMPASNQRVYVPGPVDVDWAKKQLQWWFRGTTTAPTAAVGKWRWEMSRTPFADFAPWQPASGFGYAGNADGVQFAIALDSYAPRPPDWPVAVSASAQPAPTVAQPGGGSKAGSGAPPTFSQRLGIPSDLLGLPPSKSGQAGQASKLPPALPVSLSLYVRVVPLDKAGNDADLPSNFVELRFGPAEKAPLFDVTPENWPVVTFVSYRPVQGYTFDWQCWVEASTDITAPIFWNVGIDTGTKDAKTVLFKKGTTRYVCAQDDSNIVDDFVDALGGFIEMMGDFVDWVSKTYASLKSAVASKLASVIPGCSSNPACAGAIQMGLNAGLAALGMPPDLPDFDQLQAMGEGYLVDAIAQQVAAQTNLPFADEAAKAALKEFIAQGKEAMQGGGGGASPWVPDDSKQYKPLLLTLAVSNPSATGATPAMYMDVSEPGGSRYKSRTVAVPALAPGQSVKVAVALEPFKDPKAWMELLPSTAEYLKAYPPTGSSGGWAGSLSPDPEKKLIQTKTDQADAALKNWRTAYLTGTVQLQAALKLPPFVHKVAYQTSCFADKQGCLVQ